MEGFYSYMILITLLLTWGSKCQNVEDEHTNTTDRGNTTADQLVTSPDYSVAFENRTQNIGRYTTDSSNGTSATLIYTDDLESECDECLAQLQKLVDDRRNNETGIEDKIANYCLESTAGRNELINCVTNSKAGCPGNGTILQEIQRDLDEVCQTDCSSYETIIADLDFCWTNFTQVKALETSGNYTEFCRVWREHDLCVNSTTKHCREEMTKLALKDVIERYEDETSYIRRKDNAGYVCNTECDELHLTHASSCIQFISEVLRRGDNQIETISQCRAGDPCEFEEPLEDDACPSTLELVSKVYPNHTNILMTFRKLCLADVSDCSSYETIIADLDFCWTNFTQVKALETSGNYTEFCRVWGEHDLCVNSTTKHCREEMTKLALKDVIERYEDETSYIRLKDNAGYVCNTECDELHLTRILHSASSCIQFISEVFRRGDNQTETFHQCRAGNPCQFEEPLEDDACPSTLKLVYNKYPTNILKEIRTICLAVVSAKSVKVSVTKHDHQEIVGLAAVSNDFTKRQHDETSTQFSYKAAVVITDLISTNVPVSTSSAYMGTTSPVSSDEPSVNTVASVPISSTSAHPITTALRKITQLPGKWSANGWVPCSGKEPAEVSGSTSKTNNLKANYIMTGFTVMLLRLKW